MGNGPTNLCFIMHIGIDCRTMSGKGGIAHYTYNLVKNLLIQDKKNTYVLFFGAKVSQNLKNTLEQDNCSIKYFPGSNLKKVIPFVYSHFVNGIFLNKQKLDLFHAPTGSFPLAYRGRAVITIHDLAIYKHPEWFPACQWFSKKIVVPRSLKKAKRIIAVSENTKQDIIDLFKIPQKKIQVIYEAASLASQRGRQGLMIKQSSLGAKLDNLGDYALFIGTLEPRKNLVRLIKAFALYCRKYPQKTEKLVIAGGEGWKFKQIYQTVTGFRLKTRVIFTGYISEKEKIGLLQGAKAFISPSLYEGFGLPVLEAMSLGIPVICGNNSALKEISGHASFLVDSCNIRSILEGLTKVLSNKSLREDLKAKGLVRAKQFAWSKCAKETIGLYNSIITS